MSDLELDLDDETAYWSEAVSEHTDASVSAGEQHRGQARIAYRLARAYATRLMHVHGLGWFAWDGKRWQEDRHGIAKRAVLEVLRAALAESLDDKELRADVRKCESATGVAGVLELASALEPFAFTVSDLDADAFLLNTLTGTVDLRTGEVHPHRPRDRITKITRAGYDPNATGATWHRFLERVLPDAEVRAFLQRLAGVALVGAVLEQILGILLGTGANGKSVTYKAISHALGDYATTAEPDLFMHREGAHPTGEMDLLGVRWVVVSESDRDRRLAEATMKRLTGGDPVKARRMRMDFVEFMPSHTAVLVTNHLPKVSGDDPAIWRRLRVIPFNVVIPVDERDPHLDAKLQLDADAILTWAVAGYRQYVDIGMAEPEAVTIATDDYQRSADAIARFIAEACLLNPHMYATTGELFERWCKWAAEDGAEPLSSKKFAQALDKRGHPVDKGSNRRVRRGIGLLGDNEDGAE